MFGIDLSEMSLICLLVVNSWLSVWSLDGATQTAGEGCRNDKSDNIHASLMTFLLRCALRIVNEPVCVCHCIGVCAGLQRTPCCDATDVIGA